MHKHTLKAPSKVEAAFDSFLKPVLAGLEFEEIRLKDCIHPEFLFRKGRIWFSLSWDYRDQYLDVCLGHLFWFRDVMPRVVVIGDFEHWDKSVTWDSVRSEVEFQTVFGRIGESLPEAFSNLESQYPIIFEDFRKSRGQNIKIDDYIGKEISVDGLKQYRA
jgi:hypothetical protein